MCRVQHDAKLQVCPVSVKPMAAGGMAAGASPPLDPESERFPGLSTIRCVLNSRVLCFALWCMRKRPMSVACLRLGRAIRLRGMSSAIPRPNSPNWRVVIQTTSALLNAVCTTSRSISSSASPKPLIPPFSNFLPHPESERLEFPAHSRARAPHLIGVMIQHLC